MRQPLFVSLLILVLLPFAACAQQDEAVIYEMLLREGTDREGFERKAPTSVIVTPITFDTAGMTHYAREVRKCLSRSHEEAAQFLKTPSPFDSAFCGLPRVYQTLLLKLDSVARKQPSRLQPWSSKYHLVPLTEVEKQEYQKDPVARNAEDRWEKEWRTYPNFFGYVFLSPVVFSKDQRHAALMFGIAPRYTSGGGRIVLLDLKGKQWKEYDAGRLPLWYE